MKRVLQTILRWLSRVILWKYRPIVVAVTGSVGKTSTKEAIFAVVSKKFSARKSPGNFNTEIGVPLAIIGAWNWGAYPKVLVLEMAADRPGDIAYLTSFARPAISVVTAVGQSHLEFFGTLQKISTEKTNIVTALGASGTAVLNYDDEAVRAMAGKNKGRTIFYRIAPHPTLSPEGRGVGGEGVTATNISPTPDGLVFKIHYQGNTVPVRLSGALGKPAVYAALAATGVGLSLGLNLIEIASALLTYQSLPGRLRLLPGIKNTKIIDDTYNAAPASAAAALEVLTQTPGKRKIAVLGDMAELGAYTEDGHRQVGEAVADCGINLLVTVGPKAKFISDQAARMGFSEKNILAFETADEARLPVQDLIVPGDVILIKGSRLMHMEQIVLEIMAEPEKADELLVS